MNKRLDIFLFLLPCICCLMNCSNDFLETEPVDSYALQDTLWVNDREQDYEYQINFENAINGSYIIIVFPTWICFDHMQGSFSNGTAVLTFTSCNEDKFEPGVYQGHLILKVENLGLLGIPVIYQRLGETSFGAVSNGFKQFDLH